MLGYCTVLCIIKPILQMAENAEGSFKGSEGSYILATCRKKNLIDLLLFSIRKR